MKREDLCSGDLPGVFAFSASGPECLVELCFPSACRSALYSRIRGDNGYGIWMLSLSTGKSKHAERGLYYQVSWNSDA